MKNLGKQLVGWMDCREACAFFEYGKEHKGYWTEKKFLGQLENAIKIAKIKYPKENGYRVCFVVDHSSCHGTFADDALDASKINMHRGGKQPVMHDTVKNGKMQILVDKYGRPRGIKSLLIARQVDVSGMKLEEMRAIVATHKDFQDEQPEVANMLKRNGFGCIFLPKVSL